MPNKHDLQNKIRELNEVANQLPAGEGKLAFQKLIGKLDATVNAALLDDGSSNPLLATTVPKQAMMMREGADGDGHAFVCC